jgi:sugar-specific transcriptional regulator TrmB
MKQEKLLELGLSDYEARAYLALMKQQMLAANEICKLTEIPQGRVYGVLNSLIKKGFCTLFPGAIKKYEAVHPNVAVSKVLEEKAKALEELEVFKSELSTAFDEREKDSVPLDFIQILTSKQSQIDRFDVLINKSNQTLYSFNKKPYATGFMRNEEEIKRASLPIQKTLERGTSVKALFEKEEENVELFLQLVRYYESIGEEGRICSELPLKMLLSDNKLAMVSLRNNHGSTFKLTSMVVEHSDLTNALSELFELYWNVGQSVDAYEREMKKLNKV